MRTALRAVVALAAALTLMAAPALAETHTFPGVCTLSIPAGWDMDDTSYLNENTQNEIWLADFYSEADDNAVVSLNMTNLGADWAGFSLFAEGDEGLARFREEMADTYDGLRYRYLNTVLVGDQGIPFVLSHFEDEDGPVYTAETVAAGWAIYFYAYLMDGSGDLPDAEYDAFLSILHSFTPDF